MTSENKNLQAVPEDDLPDALVPQEDLPESGSGKDKQLSDLEQYKYQQVPEALGYTLGGLGLGYGVAEEGLKGTRNAIKWAERAMSGRQTPTGTGINPNLPAAPGGQGLTPGSKYGQAMHGGTYTMSPDMSDIYAAGREATQFNQANPTWEVREGTGLAVPKPSLAEQRAAIQAEQRAANSVEGRLKTLGGAISKTAPAKLAGVAGRVLAPAYGGYQLGSQGTKGFNRLSSPEGVGDVAAGLSNVGGAALGAYTMVPSHQIKVGKYSVPSRVPAAIGSYLLGKGADLMSTKKEENKSVLENRAVGGAIKGYSTAGSVKAGLEAAKKLFVPKPTKIVKASEALGHHEGKRLGLTQTDNFGVHGERMGGNQFPNFQNISPKHAEGRVVWMNDTEPHANAMVKNSKFGDQDVIWSTYIGAPDQLKSNKTVFNDILENHYKRELTPDQIDLINNRILTMRKGKDKKLVFPQSFDIRDRFAVQELAGDTFDRRAALASMLGEGEGVNRTKSGIALPNYEDILKSHRDPLTEGVPTSSVGTRLFTVDPTPSKFSKEYHPDYEWTVHGEDMGVQFNPVPQNVIVPDWFARTEAKSPGKNRTHGNAWFSYMKDPQEITHDYLMGLEKAGFAEGGQIDGYADGRKVVDVVKNVFNPKQTQKAYKLFRTDAEGNLYPLFVNANKPVPMGEWLKAESGPLTDAGKVKSKIGPLAYRPGWHSGEFPVATHIGGKSSNELVSPDFRPANQVWAEVEHPADVDWQSVANARAQISKAGEPISSTAHITDQIPFGGNYRYKTNKNMTGDWFISGDMKVNRVLPDEEVMRINEATGIFDLPRYEPLPKKAEGGLMCLKEGGKTPAWQRKEGKNPEGGLNAAGRASYNRETGGNLKAPQPEGGSRRDSFCARMGGMKKKLTSSETANDPDSRINKALRKWNC